TTRDVTMRAITMAQDEGDVVLEDTLISYKAYVDKTLWMMQAFIGKEAYEYDDAMEEDED
ncbi:MAG: DNA starvation/stationary phase protection protein, partial [Trichococcus flocculiformis]